MLRKWQRLARELKDRDSKLRPIIEQVGPPKITFHQDYYRALATSILSQQLAPQAAKAIIARYSALCPPFPDAYKVTRWQVPKFRSAGVSAQKTRYLKALSSQWKKEAWRSHWDKLSNEELIERLTQVTGIGVWTAQMFLIFALGKTDILAVDDYGVRRGVWLLYELPDMPKPKRLAQHVSHWAGMESIGSWYLWKGLDRKLIAPKEKKSKN